MRHRPGCTRAQAHSAAVTGTAQGAAATAAAAAAAAGDPLAAVDRLGVVADLWECEAQFAAARHKALLAYFQVCVLKSTRKT